MNVVSSYYIMINGEHSVHLVLPWFCSTNTPFFFQAFNLPNVYLCGWVHSSPRRCLLLNKKSYTFIMIRQVAVLPRLSFLWHNLTNSLSSPHTIDVIVYKKFGWGIKWWNKILPFIFFYLVFQILESEFEVWFMREIFILQYKFVGFGHCPVRPIMDSNWHSLKEVSYCQDY